MKHFYSFFKDETECLYALLQIHNNGEDIELDAMYNKGHFYKNSFIKKPKYRYDLDADKCMYDALQGDATNLMDINDNSIKCMILDPPFMFGVHGKTLENNVVKRYTMFDDFEQMKSVYKGILKESYRVLCKNGILIFKCQDYTDSKTTMTHCLVYEWATELGFYAKDIAILNLDKDKIFNGNLMQQHLRKTHCYFWVFEKLTGENIKRVNAEIDVDKLIVERNIAKTGQQRLFI